MQELSSLAMKTKMDIEHWDIVSTHLETRKSEKRFYIRDGSELIEDDPDIAAAIGQGPSADITYQAIFDFHLARQLELTAQRKQDVRLSFQYLGCVSPHCSPIF